MNEKEQIGEMVEVISVHFQSELDLTNDIYNIAESLYNAGYRKQSDTIKEFAEKIVEDLEEAIESNIKGCSEAMKNGEPETYNYCLGKRFACRGIIDLINELKRNMERRNRYEINHISKNNRN